MNKVLTYGLAMVVGLGTTALLATSGRATPQTETADAESVDVQGADAQMAIDGAFRDGLHLGRLAAADGRELRPPIGRWSNERDRAAFVVGYRRGYGN
jgi:hypothetical protein